MQDGGAAVLDSEVLAPAATTATSTVGERTAERKLFALRELGFSDEKLRII